MLVMLCFGVIADALVSTGLAKLGYRYVNIGMSFTTSLTISFSLDLERVNMMNCLWHGHLDDCWDEHDRDSMVCKWGFID